MHRHTLNVLVQDHPGALHRAVSLLRRRSYNISSLAVGRSERDDASRMTLVVDAADARQVVRQLASLIEVLAVHDVTGSGAVQRETVLARVGAPGDHLAAVVSLALEFGARVVDVGDAVAIVELTDVPERVDGFIAHLQPFGILELRRSGTLAMTRGGTADGDPYPQAQADGSAGEDMQ
jgi:acetolactate synthase-1/3 small subunit